MKFIIISLCALLLATTPLSGRDGKQIMGFYSLQTGRSYINIKNNESTKDLVATSATESQRAMDHQRGIGFLQNEDDHSTYSQNFGNAVARYYGYALSSYGSGYGSAKINAPSSINQNYYASNNKEFSRLDKQKGANRQLHRAEKDFIYNNVEDFREQMSRRGINYTKEDATKLLLLSGGYGTDAYSNGLVNLGLTNFSKSEVLDGLMYLREKSKGLTFSNYNDYDELSHEQELFSATDEQFKYGLNFHQEMQGGLVDASWMMYPIGSGVKNIGARGVEALEGYLGRRALKKFDLNDLNTFRGADKDRVEQYLDNKLQGWTKEPLKKGEGIRYYDGKGGSFEINQGYAKHMDDVHGGPYLKVSVKGKAGNEKIRIPLK